jgi:hypothetical protein
MARVKTLERALWLVAVAALLLFVAGLRAGWNRDRAQWIATVEAAVIKVFSHAEDEGVEQNEGVEREDVMRELSKKYGILWRKGTARGD